MKKHRQLILGSIFLSAIIFLAVLLYLRAPISIHVRIAEDGGFMPDHIKASVGEPLRLRLIADDVEHSFALGHNPMEPVLLAPGKPVNITLTFDKPGLYTYYSTTPSSLNFWRLRGVIEVTGNEPAAQVEAPLYVRLGMDLDEEHDDPDSVHETIVWTRSPSATSGAAFESLLPTSYLSHDAYITNSPKEIFDQLQNETALQTLSDQDTWDLVAYIWQKNTSATAVEDAQQLYRVNCQSCHGETGEGDGQFASEMNAISQVNTDPHGIQAPTDFTNPEHLLGDKPVILQGKILRGGMGTGMPMWGSIFTDDELWNLVAYLYTFQLE
jgi:mono/diheme cytochrome c family protein/plastocyanin